MADLAQLRDAIINGNAKAAAAVVDAAIAEGAEPMALIHGYMIPAMDEVGRRFECEEYFVPELLLSARAMKAALAPLRPLLTSSGCRRQGRF